MSEQNDTRSPRGPRSALVTAFLAGACQQPIATPETATSAEATTSGAAPTTAAESTAESTATGVPTEATSSTTHGGGSSGEATSGPGDDCVALENPTPGAINPQEEEPKRIERLCYRALAENAISEGMAAEILGISVRELCQRMEAPETVAAE